MSYQRKPRVSVLAIKGKKLRHPIEAMVTHAKTCGYCMYEGGRTDVRTFYDWGRTKIGKVQTTYTGGCEECVEVD